ncbi:MAG: CAP domain-containing protein [Emticicia sp.]|nr:CAP domain-containing protein [Emticicia sp.]
MKNRLIFFFLAFILLSLQACSQSSEQLIGEAQLQQSVLDYVNQYRRNKGLSPLKMIPLITAEALKHSKDIADGKTPFGHDGFDGRADRIMSRIEQSNAIAENVAYGKFSAREVVNRWIASAGHRQNIEGKFTLTGIGIVKRNDGYIYFTQIFLNK